MNLNRINPPDDEYNRRWLGETRPPGWVNPAPAPRYNLVVIGAGTAGLVTAAAAAGLGAKVALVEKNLMGGDCLNVGCVPSKTLLHEAHTASLIREAFRLSRAEGDPPQADFAEVMRRVRRVRAEISPHDSARRFRELGVDVFFGEASFSGPDRVRTGEVELCFRKAVIATGARAFVPDIEGLDQTGYLTNETVFNLTEPPARLLIAGGGPIGCELAQAFQRLGSSVTLVESGDRLLPRDDADAARAVMDALMHDGVDLRCRAALQRVGISDGQSVAEILGDGVIDRLQFDRLLLAVGRRPNIEGLNLEPMGIETNSRGVVVDETLRTTNPRVYAAGDVCLPYQFTHTADFCARLVIRNALFSFLPIRARWTDWVIPWCTYTSPEAAHAGLNEDEARRRSIEFDVYRRDFAEVDRARTEGDVRGFVKILTRKGSDRIIGASIVSPHAGDMIGEIALAMTNRIGLGALSSVIHPYPTRAEAIRQCADAYNRTRLTPSKKKLLTRIWKWMR
ncbi:MAG: FAD-containing oxidoreductase [bacterium]|nr:FAD-containing oxidoreductase [bacterium]